MLADANTPGSDAWWLLKLDAALKVRRDGHGASGFSRMLKKPGDRESLRMLDAYYRGDPPLPPAVGGYGDVMRHYYRMSRLTLAPLAVETPVASMRVLGFTTAADSDFDGDQRAARIFLANQLDVALSDAFTWMVCFADAYLMVGPPRGDNQLPAITAEHPFEMITSDDPLTRLPRAALKMFHDVDLDEYRAYLYRPGYVRVASKRPQDTQWRWSDELSFQLPPTMSDVVPVRRLRSPNGMGIFEPHLDLLDRINEHVWDTLVIGKTQAYRMYLLSGVPSRGPDGELIDYGNVFTAEPGAVTVIGDPRDPEDPDALPPHPINVFESSTTDLTPLRQVVQDAIRFFSSLTHVPIHIFAPDAAQGSAEGAALLRESGVWNVEALRRRAEPQLASAMALAFRWLRDDERTDVAAIRTVWAPAERNSLAEMSDAAGKLIAAGFPAEWVALRFLQCTPDEIERINQQRADQALLAAPTPAERAAAEAAGGFGATTSPGAEG